MVQAMIKYSAMSNVQRQRKFRAAHPGYFRKYRRQSLTRAQQAATFLAQVAATEAALVAAEASTGGGEAGPTNGAMQGEQAVQ